MSLPEGACPVISGQPCDVERVAVLSGRSRDYIIGLAKKLELYPAMSEFRVELKDWDVARWALEQAKGDKWLVNQILFRLVQLASKDAEKLGSLAKEIPQDGGPLECYYLAEVVRICPGE